jgi:hypothetical protein
MRSDKGRYSAEHHPIEGKLSVFEAGLVFYIWIFSDSCHREAEAKWRLIMFRLYYNISPNDRYYIMKLVHFYLNQVSPSYEK